MIYVQPGHEGSLTHFKPRYDNFIGGEWVAPLEGRYFTNHSPLTGEHICEVARSSAADVELALDHAHKARASWAKTSTTERSNILLRIADRLEQNLEMLAVAETWENGKPIRETLNADLPLVVDHFRYFAGCIRAQEGTIGEIDANTTAYHFHEPIGVVGQIIPWNFPLLMAAWKLAPALAAGCCVVMKPASQTPTSILMLVDLIADLLPAGVINVVSGFGGEAGEVLATSKRIAKLAFTGSTPVGSHMMHCAAESIIPCTVELGGKSPNVFFADILQQEEDYISKAVEGMLMAFLNQGEICSCPSRALVQESMYDEFMEKVLERARQIRMGNPLDTDTMIGAQASQNQLDKILGYMKIGQEEGASCLLGGDRAQLDGALANGYYVQPTILKGNNDMRIFQEEIFGPVLSVATFKDEQEALAIANDTQFGLGAGVWTRDMNRAQRMGRGIEAGRVWINCYHLYPAHAAFGGYKQSGVGRETHRMILDHYQQTKNMLVSYDTSPLGFF